MKNSPEIRAMIDRVHDIVRNQNPQLYTNSSYMTVFKYALNNKHISLEQYDQAKNYYRNLFNYVGD
jgi:hypothetical protein